MEQHTQSTQATELIDELLGALGFESFEEIDVGFSIQIENSPFMDLHVEKPRSDNLAISHYRGENGRQTPDPSWIFQSITNKRRFQPITCRLPSPSDSKHDPDGLENADPLLSVHIKNIREQGFIEAAKTTRGAP